MGLYERPNIGRERDVFSAHFPLLVSSTKLRLALLKSASPRLKYLRHVESARKAAREQSRTS